MRIVAKPLYDMCVPSDENQPGYSSNLNLNLNLNSLLVKRQIDNPSPGAVTGGKLVPSSHKRGELRYAII